MFEIQLVYMSQLFLIPKSSLLVFDILATMRKLRPDNDRIPEPPENEGRDLTSIIPRARAEELLKSFFNRPGWTSLEETLAVAI
jgi:hypothetical protein